MRKIFVYADQGVDGGGLKQLIKSLKNAGFSHLIHRIDAKTLLASPWEKEAALLIIPGGQDIFYHALLDKAGTDKIRSYLEGGGSYLGICAGAYFACQSIEFEKGGDLEVCAERSLKIFPGVALGPAYGPNKYSYENAKGAEAASISWGEGTCPIYFNGGCLFHSEQEHPHVKVLSRYLDLQDTPPAILSISVGKGRAILSGVHFEYSPFYLNTEDPYLKEIIFRLKEAENQRQMIFKNVLDQLLL